MNYNCTRNKNCKSNRCAHHADTQLDCNIGRPVHSPCEWYVKHIFREERKEKLRKQRKIKLNILFNER